nr:HAD family hydrolase [bacterium]
MPLPSTVLFDLDGTLLNTLGDLAWATNEALRQQGLPGRTQEEVRAMVGNGVRRLIARAVPEGTPEAVQQAVYEGFLAAYHGHLQVQTAPYPGILPMLAHLKARGMRIGIVSNKIQSAVDGLSAAFFTGLVDCAIGERANVAKKPAPDSVYLALEALGGMDGKAVYIGDSDVDVQTAKNAGLPMIAVTWGFRSRLQLEQAGATRFADTPDALEHMLVSQMGGMA